MNAISIEEPDSHSASPKASEKAAKEEAAQEETAAKVLKQSTDGSVDLKALAMTAASKIEQVTESDVKAGIDDNEMVAAGKRKRESDDDTSKASKKRETTSAATHTFSSTMPQAPPAPSTDSRRNRAMQLGQSYVSSVMKDYEAIKGQQEMRVLWNVPDLEVVDNTRDIVVRNITEPFWQSCIDVVDTPNMHYRVAAIGTPGVGKTTCTAILIRMLLKAGKTVVYLTRTRNKSGWYYEFVPGSAAGGGSSSSETPSITTNVYAEHSTTVFDIESIEAPNTYYIVDPGKTKDSCDEGCNIAVKLILVTSPDDRHWGESEFEKERGPVMGRFRYFPLWSQEEIFEARSVLGKHLTEEELLQRYRQVGGVPSHVFSKMYSTLLKRQDDALNVLTPDQAKKIARGEVDAVGNFAPSQPKSALICYTRDEHDNGSFEECKVVPVSEVVREKIYVIIRRSLGVHDISGM